MINRYRLPPRADIAFFQGGGQELHTCEKKIYPASQKKVPFKVRLTHDDILYTIQILKFILILFNIF